MAAFKIRKLKIFLKINLDQTAGLHDNNLDCKGLISSKTYSKGRVKLTQLFRNRNHIYEILARFNFHIQLHTELGDFRM
jgi:hypothetical protein